MCSPIAGLMHWRIEVIQDSIPLVLILMISRVRSVLRYDLLLFQLLSNSIGNVTVVDHGEYCENSLWSRV